MRECSFKLRCLPFAWVLGLFLVACVSSDLDDPSQSSEDRDDMGAIAAEIADEALAPSTSSCSAPCGNGRIDTGEDCEIGLPGWTSENCSESCRQTVYPNSSPCTFEVKPTAPFVFHEQGNCRSLPGFRVSCFYLFGQYCHILCSDTEECPSGFTCNPTSGPTALGPGWCVAQR